MSHLTYLLAGLLFNASVIVKSLLFPGSVVMNGNVLFDTSNGNSAPTIMVDSGSVTTFVQQKMTLSGSSSIYAAQIPLPAIFASGAILQRAEVDCGGTAKARNLYGAVTRLAKSGTGSAAGGTLLQNFTNIPFGTGSVVVYSTGSVKVNAGFQLTFATGSGFAITASPNCLAKAVLSNRYQYSQ